MDTPAEGDLTAGVGGGGFYNQIARVEVRVAALEARTTTEISALKADTEVIRRNEHEFRGLLQQFVATAATEGTMLKEHMRLCQERSARLERVSWGAVGLGITILGFLIKIHFFPGHI